VAGAGFGYNFFDDLELPVAPNEPSYDDVMSIIEQIQFADMTRFRTIDIDILSLPPKDPQLYANVFTAEELCDSLFDEFDFPICSNEVDSDVIEDIADSMFSQPFFRPERIGLTLLINFQLEDSDHCLTPTTIETLRDWLINTASYPLPLVQNVVETAVIEKIVSRLPPFEFTAKVRVRGLSVFDPFERRIDFPFPLSAQNIFTEILATIPVMSNECNSATSLEILQGLEPLEFIEFPLRDCCALAMIEAPPEVIEFVDEIVDRLIHLIIAQDIVPVLPLLADFPFGLEKEIVAVLPWEDDVLESVSKLPIESLEQMKPNMIEREVDIRDEVEDLLLLGSAPTLEEDEFADPDVLAMLSKYSITRPLQS
jgi:hypothetical protein